jgi:hypothetical protein
MPTIVSLPAKPVLHRRQDHHLLGVVDDGEVLEPPVGELLSRGHEPAVEALVGEEVEELLEERLVGDLDRPQEDRKARLRRPPDLKAFGVDPGLAGDEGLIFVDQIQPLRLLDQPGTVVGVGD